MPITPAQTPCNQQTFEFQGLERRKIVTDFSAGFLSTDGGVLLLRETARPLGLFKKLAACFADTRNPELIEHPLETLLQQRILGLALGYEDLNRLELSATDASTLPMSGIRLELRKPERVRVKNLHFHGGGTSKGR